MGNDLCSVDLMESQINLEQKNMLIKYKNKLSSYVKPNSSQPIIHGSVKIYQLFPSQTLVYEGEMRNSVFNGYGKLFNQNKLVYEGQFKDGLFEGWGVTESYTGQFREGKYDGYGVFTEYCDQTNQFVRTYYQGYFFDGLYAGNGVVIKQARIPVTKIQRIHSEGGMIDYLYQSIQRGMQITKKYDAKEFYIGQFFNGYKHGIGRLLKNDKEFSGQFNYGVFKGKATSLDGQESNKKRKGGSSCFNSVGQEGNK